MFAWLFLLDEMSIGAASVLMLAVATYRASRREYWPYVALVPTGLVGLFYAVTRSYRSGATTRLEAIADAAFVATGAFLLLAGLVWLSHGQSKRLSTSIAAQLAKERESRQQQEALMRNERLAALGTLVAGVAHEINNPLMYLQGNTELIGLTMDDLLAEGSLDAATRAKLTGVKDLQRDALHGVERIALITKSLKQVARQPNQQRAPAKLDSIVDDAVRVARPRIGNAISVTVDQGAPQSIDVNASEISQVILNLLLNATEAVDITRGVIAVRTRTDHDDVVLEVQDNGSGIPAEVQAKMFTPFFTTKPKGTGLGLSVSHRIIQDHGGSLTFTSGPSGTTFFLKLPIAQTSTQAVKPQ